MVIKRQKEQKQVGINHKTKISIKVCYFALKKGHEYDEEFVINVNFFKINKRGVLVS